MAQTLIFSNCYFNFLTRKQMNTMKALSMITGLTLVGIVSFAQTSKVNVTFRGTSNHQVTIDGNLYSSANYSTTNSNGNRILSIPDLALGQHTLQVINANNRRIGTTTSFTLRSGYDMNISINNRGGVSFNERRSSGSTTTGQYKTAMSSSSFNNLIADIRSRRGQSSKFNIANAALTGGMNYFSASQLSQMMYQLSGESYRLQLAKNAYAYLVDPTNINRVYSSLSSTASRRELQNYIATYNSTTGNDDDDDDDNNTGVGYAVSDATFNSLMNQVRGKWLATAKMTELVNIFNNSSYYFTSSQAKQLIALTTDESNRLQLAKASYSHIVDPANFGIMYDLLATQSARNNLDLYVRSNGGTGMGSGTGSTYTTAMADAEYNALVEDVRSKWLPFSKMSTLRTIVNNSSYHFSATQARGLILLENDEPNRLELAKAIMPRLVDPANYSVMLDMFPTQSSRNDFEVYARNYR